MKRFAYIAICVLLFAVSSCTQHDKIAKRQVEFRRSVPGAVKVMTYNIRYDSGGDDPDRWEQRKDLVFDMIADHSADVIGLQEVLSSQLYDIRQALPQYGTISAGRDDGKDAGEACTILYRYDRFDITESGTFWFSNMPWKPGSKHWGNDLPRICTWVRLNEIGSGESFYVYNLHLDHRSQDSRLLSMKLLEKQISNRQHNDPVIVMGDFNMDSDNPAMTIVLSNRKGTELTDVWAYLHPGQPSITTFQAFGAQPDGPCLDHILISDALDITEAAIDGRSFSGQYASDHFPVIAEVKLHRND